MSGDVFSPSHYTVDGVETADKIEHVLFKLFGEDGVEAWRIGSALKYFDRAGLKDGTPLRDDLDKCANYFNRFSFGHWLDESDTEVADEG